MIHSRGCTTKHSVTDSPVFYSYVKLNQSLQRCEIFFFSVFDYIYIWLQNNKSVFLFKSSLIPFLVTPRDTLFAAVNPNSKLNNANFNDIAW